MGTSISLFGGFNDFLDFLFCQESTLFFTSSLFKSSSNLAMSNPKVSAYFLNNSVGSSSPDHSDCLSNKISFISQNLSCLAADSAALAAISALG